MLGEEQAVCCHVMTVGGRGDECTGHSRTVRGGVVGLATPGRRCLVGDIGVGWWKADTSRRRLFGVRCWHDPIVGRVDGHVGVEVSLIIVIA